MKKFLTILSFFSLPLQVIIAQPTKAEIDKMVKDAKAEIERFKNDPKNAEFAKMVPNMDSVKVVMSKDDKQAAIKKVSNTKASKDSLQFALPLANQKYFNALPIRTFTKAELVSYLHNLNTKLTTLLQTSNGTSITNIPINAIPKSGSSIALWINGQVNEATLVALKGAEMHPDNKTLLNNVGGILTSAGLAVNAIPILQYVLEQEPGNNLILNNLGQAYFSMGAHKKAEEYLIECIKSSEYFPDANLALAYINNAKGNKQAAIKYAENSLKGAYHPEAFNLLTKLKPDAKLMDHIRHRYKQPEFFNYHKYPILPQPMTIDEAVVLKPQYAALTKMLNEVADNYYKLGNEENKIAKITVPEKMMKAVKANRSPYRPFGMFATAVLTDLWINEYLDKFLHFGKYKENYTRELKKLRDAYESEVKAIRMRGGPCSESDAVGNKYLPQFAILRMDFKLKAIPLYNNYLNDFSYWSYLASIDDHSYKASFYGYVNMMILILKEINTAEFILPCEHEDGTSGDVEPLKVEVPDCFLSPRIVIPLGLVNIEIACEEYKLEAGIGLTGKFEYNRFSGDMTIAFGVGAPVPKLLFTYGGIKAGLEIEAKSQFFITVNKSGDLTDMGILWEAQNKYIIDIAGVKGEIEYGEAVTVGFGSGVNMKEGGPLKALIDRTYYVQPDATQINKNVPLYKK